MLSRTRLAGVGRWVLVGIAATLVVIALATVVPTWSMAVLVLHIVASEAGAWILVLAGLVLAAAAIPSPHRRLRLASAVLAVVAAVLVGLPMGTIAPAVRCADAALAQAFGDGWLAGIPSDQHARLRPTPFSVRDALLGMPIPPIEPRRIEIPAPGGATQILLRYGDAEPGSLRPVVVVIHGGGWRGGSAEECAACQRHLATHGYVVYALDYRTAPGTRYPGQLEDVQMALTWIQEHAAESGGDPSRLVVMGRSAGSQLAMILAYSRPQPAIRAVVGWYGPIDLAVGYREPPQPDPLGVRECISDYLGGSPDELPGAYAQASPITYATRPQPPTLLICGGADQLVLLRYQREFRDRLAATGTRAALIELPWAEHGFDHLANGPGAQVSLYFLERFLAYATAR